MKILKPCVPDFDFNSDLNKQHEDFKTMHDIWKNGNGRKDNVVFSEEGMAALRAEGKRLEPVYVMSAEDTNEVEWEHYIAMKKDIDQTLKYVKYDVEDYMKAMMDTYERYYNNIVKIHEKGDRHVKFNLSGESYLTLEQDLAQLDRAFQRMLGDVEAYIFCQQTHDGKKYFQCPDRKKEDTEQKKYRDTAVAMMERAQKKLSEMREQPDYMEGVGWRIIWDIMKSDTAFREQTRKYFD